MADNLLEMAVRQLGSSGIGALGSALGLPEGKGESAVKTGLSTVLAGMLNKGSSKTGMASLFNMVTGSSGLDFSNIGEVFKDPEQMNSLQKSGGNMLETVFGSKSSDVTNVLSNSLGLSGGTGGSLLKVAAPIAMSLLGKLVKSKGLDISSMASLLLGQKAHIKDHVPSGLMKELGVSDFSKLGETLETHGHEQPQEAHLHHKKREKKRSGFAKWFWPLLIALAALYALNMCAKKDEVGDQPGEVILEDETTMTEEAPDDSTATPDAGEPATGDSGEMSGDFGTSFREYIDSAARDPDREFPLTIEFARDSAEVADSSAPDVETLATVLQENPGITVAIVGHTSSEGDEARNRELSQARAEAVRQMIVDRGIEGSRVTATGMGSAKPVADNETEEGREKNRRISVQVVTFD